MHIAVTFENFTNNKIFTITFMYIANAKPDESKYL